MEGSKVALFLTWRGNFAGLAWRGVDKSDGNYVLCGEARRGIGLDKLTSH